MTTYIKDENSNTYYAVECSSNQKGYITSADDEGTPGDFDFPYWTSDIHEAFNFKSETFANHEMKLNDLTEGGSRNPVIVKERTFLVEVEEALDWKDGYLNSDNEVVESIKEAQEFRNLDDAENAASMFNMEYGRNGRIYARVR